MGKIRFQAGRAAVLVASLFATLGAFANPTGGTFVAGGGTISPNGNILTITNTPNSIINWQQFSISPNEITSFIQQNSASAVLNRVIGQNPSSLLGSLQSNGRVYLINPNGVLFGSGTQINTAAFVATTFDVPDNDFLSGNAAFLSGGTGIQAEVGVISVTASVSLSNSGLTLSNCNVAAGGNISLSSSGPITIDGGITAAGDIALQSQGTVTMTGQISVAGQARVDGSVVLGTNNVTATNGTIITVNNSGNTANIPGSGTGGSGAAPAPSTSAPSIDTAPAIRSNRVGGGVSSVASLGGGSTVAGGSAFVASVATSLEIAVNLQKREPLY